MKYKKIKNQIKEVQKTKNYANPKWTGVESVNVTKMFHDRKNVERSKKLTRCHRERVIRWGHVGRVQAQHFITETSAGDVKVGHVGYLLQTRSVCKPRCSKTQLLLSCFVCCFCCFYVMLTITDSTACTVSVV